MTGILPLWADTTEDSPGSLTRLRFALRFTWKSFYVRLCAAIAIIIFLWHSRGEVTETVRSSTRGFRRNTLSDVYNNTLGFQKVYGIGFESRTDKRDAKTLASSFTGFHIDWVPAVAGEDVSPKAAPARWNFEKQTAGALGCWRAHMNVIQRIVSENIQTALLFEDDADWDVNLKHQLYDMATGTRALQEDTASQSSSPSPYGSDWDLLWLGHCRAGPADREQKMWVIDDDPTVPPHNHRRSEWRQHHYPEEMRRNNTRLLFETYGGMCTFSYAISFNGARKMLTSLSLQYQDEPVDIGLSALCRNKFTRPFKCYAPYPPLVSSHRSAGSASRDSEITSHGDKYHEAYSWDIVYSTLLNVPRLVEGERTVRPQWPQEGLPDLRWDETPLTSPKGYLKTIAVQEATTDPHAPYGMVGERTSEE